jgi:hypothetical protein
MSRKRCKCHSSDLYATLIECPRCRHWSYDRWAGSCERRKCGYEVPARTTVTEVDVRLDFGL